MRDRLEVRFLDHKLELVLLNQWRSQNLDILVEIVCKLKVEDGLVSKKLIISNSSKTGKNRGLSFLRSNLQLG